MPALSRRTPLLGLCSLSLAVMGAQAAPQDSFQSFPVLGSASTDQVYTPVVPCRFVDGINANDRVTISVANGTTSRYYRVRGNASADFVSQGAAGTAPNGCGIPLSASAVMVNLTVADPSADGDLKADPADVSGPSSTSALNYTFGGARGKNLANAVVVKLCDLGVGSCASGASPTVPTRDILVTFHGAVGSTFFIADVLGYFAPAIVPTPTSFSGNLAGEVTGTQSATVVSNAVSANTVSAIVRRDASGGFSAGSVTLTDNLILANPSTSTTGTIMKGTNRFVHNYGASNTFIGEFAGNFTMTGADNTAAGANTLENNTTGIDNTAGGRSALLGNTTGNSNTAFGRFALTTNTSGSFNTAIGSFANVSTGALTNATAVGYLATVNASNKVRLGNTAVTVIEGQVAYTFTSDRRQKENFRRVDARAVLAKLRGVDVTSWNYIGHDPKEFRHYGPMAQDFYEAFGHDEMGAIGTDTTINSGDITGILMVGLKGMDEQMQQDQRTMAAQAASLKQQAERIADLERETAELASLKEQVSSMGELLKSLSQQSAVTRGSLIAGSQERR
jgi:hypothetical protein